MELTIELDEARTLMYETLSDELDEEVLETTINRAIQQKITSLYDNKDNLEKRD